MFSKSCSIDKFMGCCSCFGFTRKRNPLARPTSGFNNCLTQEFLLDGDMEDDYDCSYNGDVTSTGRGGESDAQSADHSDDGEPRIRPKRSEDILQLREQMGLVCRQFAVKETHKLVRTEDEDGTKVVNEYVREHKIGCGSYGKVVLYRSRADGKHYALKSFHKSHLLKQRVAPSETAMTDVLREVQIMKMLEHPNIVNLIEVINDPETDHFYMVLEYVEGKWVCEGSDPPCSLEENTVKKYMRDIVAGLMYLHEHKIIHGDIKPDNLLITHNGTVKIGDFNVSQVFEDDNDELRRSPGTPVFTAPECCIGVTYGGKAADTWALGVTLHCMIIGRYPFLGDSLQDTYDKIVNSPVILPDDLNPLLKNLLEGLLCKDPVQRMTLKDVSEHSWIVGDNGPLPQYLCWCRRKMLHEKSGVDKEKDETSTTHTD